MRDDGMDDDRTTGAAGGDGRLGFEPWLGASAGLPPHPSPYGAPPPTPYGPLPPRRRRGRVAVLAIAVAVALLVAALGSGFNLGSGVGTPSVGVGVGGARGVRSPLDAPTKAIANAVSPAIVNIDTFARSFGSTQLSPLGAGTGMILSSSGTVLTNNHVVQGAERVDVSIQGQTDPVVADVVGVDPTDDVALLRLPGESGLPTVTVGNPDTLTVGQGVVALGNALGKGGPPQVTAGSVSGLHRMIVASDPGGQSSEHLHDVIATDARILPGDSGGALTDANGRVVGMITAGGTRGDRTTPRLAFAVPIDNAISVVREMRAGHETGSILLGDRGFLGVAVHPLDPQTAADLGVAQGALVVGVEPNGPAASIGMAHPSVITNVDGHAVSSLDDLGTFLHAHVPGEHVSVSWTDRSGTHQAIATLTTGPVV
jgi:S1-C subfamily serine protease